MKTVVQHCFGKQGSGGPVVALERLLSHSKITFPVIRQTEPARGINLTLIQRFRKEIRFYNPDLIHIRGLGNEGFHAAIAARLARVPRILVSVHGTQRDLLYPPSRLRHPVVKTILEPLTLRLATHIATVSECAAKRDFLLPYQHKLVGAVPNGVPIPSIANDNNSKLKEQYAIPDDYVVGICVSRITKEKGFGVLAEALKKIDNPEMRLAVLVVGGGDEDNSIQKEFKNLKHIIVKFAGHQSDIGFFLSGSDFFIFPTLHENLSNALLEALSYGLPTIATAVGGNVEVINRGGGLLIEPNDPSTLSEKIQSFTSNPDALKKLSTDAKANILNNYSINHMVDNWNSVYENILGDSDFFSE